MRYYSLGFLLIIAVLSCHNDLDKEEYKTNKNLPQLRSEWAREYEAWKKLDIQNYQFTYLPDGHGPGWGLRITVKNGQFHEAINIITENQYDYYKLTIDDVFSLINNSFDEDKKMGDGHIGTSFRVEYDPEYHFPAFFSIVRIFNQPVGSNGNRTIIKYFTIIDE